MPQNKDSEYERKLKIKLAVLEGAKKTRKIDKRLLEMFHRGSKIVERKIDKDRHRKGPHGRTDSYRND